MANDKEILKKLYKIAANQQKILHKLAQTQTADPRTILAALSAAGNGPVLVKLQQLTNSGSLSPKLTFSGVDYDELADNKFNFKIPKIIVSSSADVKEKIEAQQEELVKAIQQAVNAALQDDRFKGNQVTWGQPIAFEYIKTP